MGSSQESHEAVVPVEQVQAQGWVHGAGEEGQANDTFGARTSDSYCRIRNGIQVRERMTSVFLI